MSGRPRPVRAGRARLGVRPWALLASLALTLLALALWEAGGARGAQADGDLAVHAQLSPAFGALLMGSAPQGTTGDPTEVWAFQVLDGAVARPVVEGSPLPFAAGPGTGQLALLRYTDATGWRFVQTPLDESGTPYRGGRPLPDGGRVTARGGIALATNDGTRGSSPATQHVLMVADRGAPLRTRPVPPDASVLLPGGGSQSPEALSLRVLAATDDGDRTRAYVAIEGPFRERAVAAWSGESWSREPICAADQNGAAPPGCAADETLAGSPNTLRVVALAAAGARGWMLVRPQEDTGRGITLFERRGDGATARWVSRPLGRPGFDRSAGAVDGVTAMAALPSPRALTATDAGVWIDGRFDLRGRSTDLTAYFDGQGTTAWCDADALCQRPLGLRFSAERHRSFAWPGEGVGSRIIAPVMGTGDAEAYARLEGAVFVQRESFNPRPGRGSAFGAPDEGWLGLSHISRQDDPATRAIWPIPVRRPLTAIAGAPEQLPGDIAAQALGVGLAGTVLRYTPGQGWDSEQLLGASGVARDNLRGVSWPTPGFAFAVGDRGSMWRWDRATGLWEPDPGAPFDFQAHLTGVAFQPGNPERGYAVGRGGTLLRYDKSWTSEELPAELRASGPQDGPEDLMGVAFAGSEALVAAWDHLLVNDGSGWRVDAGAQGLLDQVSGRIYAVAGLPDGGAVAAGVDVVLLRDGPNGPWRFADQPLPDQVVTAVSAIREDGQVRAVAAISPGATSWPPAADTDLPPTDPGRPPALAPPFSLPSDGTVLRQTATGWRDEERSQERSPTADAPLKNDPTTAMLLDPSGRGWLVGGWNGEPDFAGRGRNDAFDVQTASVTRYAPVGPEQAPGLRASNVETPPGPLRLLVGGHAQCETRCVAQAPLTLTPDLTLAAARQQASVLSALPGGPRALLYTGGRVPVDEADEPQPQAEADRLAGLLGVGAAQSVFAATAPGDETGGTAGAFQRAFQGAAAPFGGGAAAAGATPVELGAAPAAGLARTHYAVDFQEGGGRVRVIVIDNAAGSLSAGEALQNPREPQRPWLTRVLEDARANGIAAIVMGNRSLNPQDGSRAAVDAREVAVLLRDNGASAYLYDSPERQVVSTIPVGEPGIPAFGSGTLGYRDLGDSEGFGVPALLMLEVDAARRDEATSRAPIATRLIPLIEDLALEAIDGRVLNRSRPALFRALGRRPRSGDDWFRTTGGSDPYVQLPNPSCAASGCAGRLEPEVRFTSSDPDIANFVRQDPASTNQRKPFVDPATDKPVADAASGLLCAFNAGTTTISVAAGGLTYTTRLTVRGGSVLRPCGTVPLTPRNLPAQQATAPVAPAPPVAQPQPEPPAADVDVPAPVPPPPVAATPTAASPPAPAPPAVLPPAANPQAVVGTIVPPPGLSPRPIPPSGTSPVSSPGSVVQPATKVEKQREEELAPEQQQSAVRYVHGSGNSIPPAAVLALLLAMGVLGAGVRPRSQRRDRGEELALSYAPAARRRH